MFNNSFEVPAKKVIHCGFFTAPWFYTFWVVVRVSVRKTLRKYLIPNCIFYPLRCIEHFILMKIRDGEITARVIWRFFEKTFFCVNDLFVCRLNLKSVSDSPERRLHIDMPIIELAIAAGKGHWFFFIMPISIIENIRI